MYSFFTAVLDRSGIYKCCLMSFLLLSTIQLHLYGVMYVCSFQISTNGVISFRSKFDSFNPVPFPSSLEPLIAPLWADFDFRELGSIYYRVTQDPRILTKFSNIVSEKNPNINYHPTLCVIMTWDSATFHSNGFRIAVSWRNFSL